MTEHGVTTETALPYARIGTVIGRPNVSSFTHWAAAVLGRIRVEIVVPISIDSGSKRQRRSAEPSPSGSAAIR
ncbi:hypothetical protein CP557_08490 [Natrinema ejinorense]|uniref:Uncharacterized protein n=1 Tax=Natrinema ejinorense TaxID=373386 RepID=A0A2A5QUN9_9EURY|nr:hypothetical protein CP557_08490 [Natrinema ejinorense]